MVVPLKTKPCVCCAFTADTTDLAIASKRPRMPGISVFIYCTIAPSSPPSGCNVSGELPSNTFTGISLGVTVGGGCGDANCRLTGRDVLPSTNVEFPITTVAAPLACEITRVPAILDNWSSRKSRWSRKSFAVLPFDSDVTMRSFNSATCAANPLICEIVLVSRSVDVARCCVSWVS